MKKAPLNDNSPARLFDRYSDAPNHDYCITLRSKFQFRNEYFSLRVKNLLVVLTVMVNLSVMTQENDISKTQALKNSTFYSEGSSASFVESYISNYQRLFSPLSTI